MSIGLEELRDEFENLMEKSGADRISITYAPEQNELESDMSILTFFDDEVETVLIEEEDYGKLSLEDTIDWLLEEIE